MNSELSMNRVLIEKLTNILEVNLEKEHFGVKELAIEAGLSRSKLHRKLKSLKGKSASKFICEFRLKKAMVMLQNNVATASEIAYRVGFSSPTYFNTCFHDYYGYPPGEVKFRNPIVAEDNVETKNVELTEDSLITKEIEPTKKGRLRKRMVFINTFVIVVLSIVIYNLYQKYQNSLPSEIFNTSNNEKSIAILHFKNLSTDIENQYFVDGMMNDVLNHLSGIQGLVVKSAQSSEKYRESNKTALQIGEELGVNYLLDGSFQKYGDSVRIITHLIDAKEDRQLSSIVFNWEFKNIFTLQNKIAHEIANELNITLSPTELEKIDKKPTENLAAYNLYLKGRFFWHRRTEEDLNKSIEYFEKALELDSTYALAYSGLADSYFIKAWWGWLPENIGYNRGKEFALKALSIDNNIAEAHATLGGILNWSELKWKDAEKELKLAITLKPGYATAHQYYAELLNAMGKSKEAIEQIDLALKLNPNSLVMNNLSAMYYFREARFEEAIIYTNRSTEIDKRRGNKKLFFAEIYIEQGKYDKAITEIENYYKLDSNSVEGAKGVREAYEKLGIKGLYRFMIAFDLKRGFAYERPFYHATRYAFLNDTEKTLEWLEKAYEKDAKSIWGIQTDFRFKKLHDEPRFIALMKKNELLYQ